MSSVRVRLAGALVCLGMASGMLISLPLWLSRRDFPFTPPWTPLELLVLPPPLDLLLLFAFFGALALAAITGHRVAFGACFVLALLLALPDLQRWQPWFYQYVFMLGALAFGLKDALGTLRLIVAATYIFSGLQKVHASFFEDGMQLFLEPFGLAQELSWITLCAPFAEAAVGLGLLFSRTRSIAALAAVGMHAFLLLALGPLGQDFNPVVWPWNVVMASVVMLLFFRTAEDTTIVPSSAYGFAVFLLFLVMPVFGLFGAWPPYLSASLYSQNTKEAYVFDGAGYSSVSSLTYSTTETPAYPAEAVFFSAANRACERHGEKLGRARPVMEVFSRPDLFTGERSSRIYFCKDVRMGTR